MQKENKLNSSYQTKHHQVSQIFRDLMYVQNVILGERNITGKLRLKKNRLRNAYLMILAVIPRPHSFLISDIYVQFTIIWFIKYFVLRLSLLALRTKLSDTTLKSLLFGRSFLDLTVLDFLSIISAL